MPLSLAAIDRRDLNVIFAKLFQLVGYTYGGTQGGANLGEIIAAGLSDLSELSSLDANKGASLVGVRDAGGKLAAANVEDALAELADSIASVSGTAAAAVAVTNGGAGNNGKLLKLDAQGKLAGFVLEQAISVTSGGAGDAGKLFKADAQGKLDGRVLATDGAKLDKYPSPGAVGRILYSDGTNFVELAPGTAGQYLRAAGAAAPAWANIAATELPATVLGAAQSLSGAGAADVVTRTTYLTTTAAEEAVTLADGAYTGQIKRIVASSGYDGTKTTVITPANGPAVTLVCANDFVVYEWNGAAWAIAEIQLKPQIGQITLTAGTVTKNAGITLAATDEIFLSVVTPGTGGNGTHYKITGRTNGGPGTGAFTVTACAAADGATVNTDVSVLSYMIVRK